MILVKCTLFKKDYSQGQNALAKERLRKAILDQKIEGSYESKGATKDVTGLNGNMVHTSAILKEFSTFRPSGFIFETDDTPAAVLPFDRRFILFLNDVKRFNSQREPDNKTYLELVKKFKKAFVFDSVPAMAERFSNSDDAAQLSYDILSEYKDEIYQVAEKKGLDTKKSPEKIYFFEDLYKKQIWEIRNVFRWTHNEVIFEDQVKIKNVLSLFGDKRKLEKGFDLAELPLDHELLTRKIYPTAEDYFKENGVTYE